MKKFVNKKNNLAVSETIGFIIIFGIVMTGIGIVTLYGYPALLQEQENTNIKNMQKNMLVLQSDVKSLTYKNVPYQETAIQVSGGTLLIQNTTGPDPSFTINCSDCSQSVDIDFKPGELHFISSSGMESISLENGGVHIQYWSSPDGSAMISNPSWFLDKTCSTFVIHLIKMEPASPYMAQTGIGTIRMQLLESSQDEPYNISGQDVTICYHPSFTDNYKVAWRNYFSSPDLYLSLTDPTGPCAKINTTLVKTLIIKRYNISVLSL
jgi:hypothetical protein